MSSTKNVKRIPEDMHVVTPHLVCAGAAEAIEFYKKAFGATEGGRLPGPGGKLMHELDAATWDRVMAVNLDSLMHCCRRFKSALPSARASR